MIEPAGNRPMDQLPAVLIVDDEPIVVVTLRVHLRRILGQEWNVLVAHSGSEALQLVDSYLGGGGTIPLVLVDYQMHPMKGDILLRHLQERLPDSNKIMISGQADLEAVADIISQVKLFRYMSKPWDPQDLERTVQRAIGRA
jgi:DNA-binding NtrC family response regulator